MGGSCTYTHSKAIVRGRGNDHLLFACFKVSPSLESPFFSLAMPISLCLTVTAGRMCSHIALRVTRRDEAGDPKFQRRRHIERHKLSSPNTQSDTDRA